MLRKIGLALLLCLTLATHARAQDRSTPEAAARTFLAAFGVVDVATAACVQGPRTSREEAETRAKAIKTGPATFTLTERVTSITGSTADFTGKIAVSSGDPVRVDSCSTHTRIVQVGSGWLIVPSSNLRPDGPAPDLIVGLATFLGDPRMRAMASDLGRQAVCLSNL